MNAVNSEFQKDRPQDSWREWELVKHMANPLHPFHRFAIGDIETLNKTDIVDQLHGYYDQQYSANRMTLVVLGRETTAELGAMVERSFAAAVDKHLPLTRDYKVPAFTTAQLGYRAWFDSAMSTPTITLYWSLPPFSTLHGRSGVVGYLSSIFGEVGTAVLLLVTPLAWDLLAVYFC